MADKKKPLVLVVEDDMNSQMLMNYYLRNTYEVDFAVSVTGAKIKLMDQHVDIILLDLSLEAGEDGLDLARYIRKEGKWPNMFIIATTAHAFTADRDNCIAAGCDDYLAKPIKKADLLDMISKYFSNKDS
ncbi:MAG: response regulator [Candidatus Marinimicrobia bacterium]|nr:response regulator [Candidatus Neomarinimicrobiota bacterium]